VASEEENPEVVAFRRRLEDSTRIVVFTGAGISTDSGIPDYRSQGGIWERFRPVYFDEFIESEEKRLLYWHRKQELWPALVAAEPNEAHHLVRRLYDEGRLLGVITQNIDGLHERSGIPASAIVNIHGNTRETVCLGCGALLPTDAALELLGKQESAPRCPDCGGLLKPNTISFGQALDETVLRRAVDLSEKCDTMLVLGSTLVVQPAATLPATAKESGAWLGIVTLSETPLDDSADAVLRMPLRDFAHSMAPS
jgi:NAD-dependent deacetylase